MITAQADYLSGPGNSVQLPGPALLGNLVSRPWSTLYCCMQPAPAHPLRTTAAWATRAVACRTGRSPH